MMVSKFIPFPALTTQRLTLRSLELSDAEDIFKHRSDDEVNMYLDDFRHSSIDQSIAFIERVQTEIQMGKTILWVINEKGHNRFIGTVCLWNISWEEQKAETGYTLDSRCHRNGYMNEALAMVIDFGFNALHLKRIEAYTHEQNQGSIKLLKKNHFIQDVNPKGVGDNNRIFFTLTINQENVKT